MEFISKNKKVIIGLLILIGLIYFGYATVFTGSATPSDIMGSGTELTPDGPAQDILNAVEKFKNISIDETVFKSNVFLTLQDFSSIVTPEQQGRSNPFAPIGQGGVYIPTSTGSIQVASTTSRTSTTTPPTKAPSSTRNI